MQPMIGAGCGLGMESCLPSNLVLLCVIFCQVTVPGQVMDVACGVDHMVALVKSLL